MTISKKILHDIKSGKIDGCDNNDMVIMSWGVDKFIGNDVPDIYGYGSVKFKANASKFTGVIIVRLNYANRYDIVFQKLNNKTGINQTVGNTNNLTPDRLLQVIDDYVNGPNE